MPLHALRMCQPAAAAIARLALRRMLEASWINLVIKRRLWLYALLNVALILILLLMPAT